MVAVLTHIVLYRLKGTATAEQIGHLLDQARAQLPRVPGVRNLRAGRSTNRDDPFQYALVMDFEGREGLEVYRVHPIHIQFVEQVVKPLVDEVQRLDYTDEAGSDD